ncbi:MAG: D-alanine--D-alanine ligase [Chloroflexi bacterium RBG_13_60_13]|nr:MAG: D-alanine--D-alanine ligase [Chloroflexi bacterium RBG_13_60_13]
MKIGLSYDLKDSVPRTEASPDDCLEEYDSLETVEAIARAIEARSHSVVRLGGGRGFLTAVLKENVDLVFNIAEGLGNYRSREAQVPSALEMLDVPYTGSDPLCLAVCLDKAMTKSLVALAGVSTPRWQVVNSTGQLKETDWGSFPIPAFIKPAHEGSSKGIRLASRADSPGQIAETAERLLEHYRQPVMVEEYIAGDEVTVGVLGNSPPRVVGIMRVLPKKKTDYFVYSLEVKREWESLVDYECPARLEPEVLKSIADSALTAFRVLGCRDLARIDFRVASDGTPYFLEINPLPGLNPRSGDLPIMAGKMGWTHQALISAILDAALRRCQQ